MRSFKNLFPERVGGSTSTTNLTGPIELFQIKQDTFRITDFNTFSTYTVEANFGTVSRVGDLITILPDRNAPVGPREIAITRDGIRRVIPIPVNRSFISAPIITSPSNDAVGQQVRPTVTLAALSTSTPVALGSHDSTEWEFAADALFNNLLLTYTTIGAARLTTTPTADLPANAQVFIRARSVSTLLGSSDWSNVVAINTVGVNTPTITGVNGETFASGRVTRNFSAASSAYGGVGTHASSQWQVFNLNDASGTPIHDSGEVGGTRLRAYSPQQAGFNLTRGTTYWIRVRYKSNGGIWSNYSGLFAVTIALLQTETQQVCRNTTARNTIYGDVEICHYGRPEGHPDIPISGAYAITPCSTPPSGDGWFEFPEMRGFEVLRIDTVNTTICSNVTNTYEY